MSGQPLVYLLYASTHAVDLDPVSVGSFDRIPAYHPPLLVTLRHLHIGWSGWCRSPIWIDDDPELTWFAETLPTIDEIFASILDVQVELILAFTQFLNCRNDMA